MLPNHPFNADGPKAARRLSELPVSELESFCHSKPEGTYSSLGIISDEILRRDK